MTRFAFAALAVLALAPAVSRADEAGAGGGGDVQAHPKELTGPGTKGSKLKGTPKSNPVAAPKVDTTATKAASAPAPAVVKDVVEK